jgi:hypothetical protein
VRPEEQVEMVGHQGPSQAFGAGFQQQPGEVSDKVLPVGIIAEDVAPFHSPDHDVVQEVRDIQTGSARHGQSITESKNYSTIEQRPSGFPYGWGTFPKPSGG